MLFVLQKKSAVNSQELIAKFFLFRQRIKFTTRGLNPNDDGRQNRENNSAADDVGNAEPVDEESAEGRARHATEIGRSQKNSVGKVGSFGCGAENPKLINVGSDTGQNPPENYQRGQKIKIRLIEQRDIDGGQDERKNFHRGQRTQRQQIPGQHAPENIAHAEREKHCADRRGRDH